MVQALAEGVRGEHEVSVLCSVPAGAGREETINGVRVVRAGSLGMVLGMPLSFQFLFMFRREAREADILHFHEPFPLGVLMWWLFRPKKKIVVTYHSDLIRQKFFIPLYKPFLRSFLKNAHIIIPTSQRLAKYSYILPNFKEKLTPIPLGIDLEKFSRVSEASKKIITTIKQKHKEPLLLFVGRSSYYKGLSVLLEAMDGIDAQLLLVGIEDEDIDIPNKIKRRVSAIGRVSDEELCAYYNVADVFVFPSTHPSEAFGLAQVEAMAAGLPVINTNLHTGVPWVSLHEQTGLTVIPGDVGELRSAIIRLLDDRKLRKKFGLNAKKQASLFSKGQMLSRYKKIYSSL